MGGVMYGFVSDNLGRGRRPRRPVSLPRGGDVLFCPCRQKSTKRTPPKARHPRCLPWGSNHLICATFCSRKRSDCAYRSRFDGCPRCRWNTDHLGGHLFNPRLPFTPFFILHSALCIVHFPVSSKAPTVPSLGIQPPHLRDLLLPQKV